MTVKLASSLPKADEANGLAANAATYLAEGPGSLHVAVVVFVVNKCSNEETGDSIPTLRVGRVEPILDDQDCARMGRIATRAFERRTGATVLPLDMEDEIRAAFGDLDGETE